MPMLAATEQTMASPAFKATLAGLAGYNGTRSGSLLEIESLFK
jgi:hypothetical protein